MIAVYIDKITCVMRFVTLMCVLKGDNSGFSMTCEMNNLEIVKFVFSLDVILCG